MRVYFISLFNLFTLQELRLMAGIGIEVWLQESGSKLGYKSWDRSLVTGIGIEVGLQEVRSSRWQELRLVADQRNWDWTCWWTPSR